MTLTLPEVLEGINASSAAGIICTAQNFEMFFNPVTIAERLIFRPRTLKTLRATTRAQMINNNETEAINLSRYGNGFSALYDRIMMEIKIRGKRKNQLFINEFSRV